MTTRNKLCRLLISLATVAVVWLGVLPRLCDQPDIAQHIRTQQQLNIDPSALFYTELDVMPLIIHRVELLK